MRVKRNVLVLLLVTVLMSTSVMMPSLPFIEVKAKAAVQAPALEEKIKTLYVGDNTYSVKLKNIVKDAKITYTTKNKRIATVDRNGRITPICEGKVDIVTEVKQKSKAFELVVNLAVEEPNMEFTQSVDYLNVGEEVYFEAKANGSKDKVTWSVSDGAKATISNTGKLTALTAGKVTLTAKSGMLKVEQDIVIGTNRISTLLKNITIYEDTTIWITTSDDRDEELSVETANGNVVKGSWGKWDGNRQPLNVKILGKGKDTLTVTTNISNDRVMIHVTVIDKPKDRKDLSAVEIYDKCGSSAVEIAASSDYSKSIGSGFFIGNGMLVTNYHVILGMKKIVVTTSSNDSFVVTKILGFDEKLDLAILQVDDKYDGLEISQMKAKVGENIYTLGSPMGLTGTMTDGMITTASRILDNVDYIQINASISGGNSGGPLINAFGEVIGVNTMYYVGGQNLNFAININELKKVYLNHPVTVEEYFTQYNEDMNSVFENMKIIYKEGLIYEDSSKSGYLDTCQYVPFLNGVSGTMQAGEKWDLYYFKVTEPSWVGGKVYSETAVDVMNTFCSIYDENIEKVVLANEYPQERFQYFKEYLNPGIYYVCISLSDGYSGADVPYMFHLFTE